VKPQRLQPIEESKKTIAAIVQDRIRAAILDGILTAGSRIDQNQLAVDLNVSIVPVREALKKLEAEGFVQIIPRRGAFVTETSLDDMEELYFARAIVEGQAAYHAAEKLTDEDLGLLDKLMDEMTVALDTQNYPQFMESNHEFHFLIYDAAGSRHLSNVITSLWELAERYRYRYVFLKDQASVIQAEHQAILDACHARDSKRLRDSIVYHMQQTLAGVKSYIMSAVNHTDTVKE
jgi:DNA-binding GntR family transcriptional regulator